MIRIIQILLWIFFFHFLSLRGEELVSFQYEERNGKFIFPKTNPFDWISYLESHPSIVNRVTNRIDAFHHYTKKGKIQKNLPCPMVLPPLDALRIALQKFYSYTDALNHLKISQQERTFILYYLNAHTSLKLPITPIINNELLFNATIAADQGNTSTNFYWIVVVCSERSHLKDYLTPRGKNTVITEIPWYWGEPLCLLRMLQLLQPYLMKNYGSIHFLSNSVRGPLLYSDQGEWLKEYRSLLFQPLNNVGIVGPTLICDPKGVSIHLHTFMIRTTTIPILLKNFLPIESIDIWINYLKNVHFIITSSLQAANYNISSYLYYKRVNMSYFNGKCLIHNEQQKDSRYLDPSKWCDITPEEVIFYDFSAELFRVPGIICTDIQEIHRQYLIQNADRINQWNHKTLKLPETLFSGQRYDLYHQYEQEIFRGVVNRNLSIKSIAGKRFRQIPIDKNGDKICFLVRTAMIHGAKQHGGTVVDTVTSAGIDEITSALLRQSDPNWEAIYFVTDHRPFETVLVQMLAKYNDSRLSYFDIPLQYRPPYSSVDAAYTPTDYALSHILHRKDCRWISATNADNIYGTRVVENVRKTMFPQNNDDDDSPGIPDMVFVPLDSRNIADQDYETRRTRDQWNQYCTGITAMIKLNAFTYTMQPRPFVGKVDLAAVFFNREKWLNENIFFSNFTDPSNHRCKGCQDGYFTEYLVHNRFWTYRRLPIDGLKSIVFHGPSPTWCIASGNVWFDHPDVSKVRCYSQRTASSIKYVDIPPKFIFDWHHFDDQERLCLRFSQAGFQKYLVVKATKSKPTH